MLYPGWRSFFSSLFCHALFQSRNFCGTFFISAIDFCLQDSLIFNFLSLIQSMSKNKHKKITSYALHK